RGGTEGALAAPEVGEVAVECRRRPLPGLLQRMDGELERNAAGVADAVADPAGELDVVTVARHQIVAGLRDPDNGPARLQLRAGQPEVEVPLEVRRGHS